MSKQLPKMEGQSENEPRDDENVKKALESLFSDSSHGDSSKDIPQINVEDIPENVRHILVDKWRKLRFDLDSSRPRAPADPHRGNTGNIAMGTWLIHLCKHEKSQPQPAVPLFCEFIMCRATLSGFRRKVVGGGEGTKS